MWLFFPFKRSESFRKCNSRALRVNTKAFADRVKVVLRARKRKWMWMWGGVGDCQGGRREREWGRPLGLCLRICLNSLHL